jgi:uncharacterized pyridoxal phosphate-containing UPF0001 family protein
MARVNCRYDRERNGMNLGQLDQLIKAVAPIDGINTNGVIWFKPEATDEQKAAAQALMDEHLASIQA